MNQWRQTTAFPYRKVIIAGTGIAVGTALLGAVWLLVRGQAVTAPSLSGPLFWVGALCTTVAALTVGPESRRPRRRWGLPGNADAVADKEPSPQQRAADRRSRDQAAATAGVAAVVCFAAAFVVAYLIH